MNISLLTYNICHGIGMDNKYNIERQSKFIKETNVDVALIQELDFYNRRSGINENQLAIISELSEHMYYSAGINYEFKDGYYGNGIISKYPIIGSTNYPFKRVNITNERKGLLYNKILINNKIFHIFTTHFSVYEDERVLAAKMIIDIIKHSNKNDYIIIGGDFNVGTIKVGDHKYEYDPSEDIIEYDIIQKKLNKVDNTEITWRSTIGSGCLDTFFYSDNLELINFETIKNDYSDHYPIKVEFHIDDWKDVQLR